MFISLWMSLHMMISSATQSSITPYMKQIRSYDHAGELLRNPQVGNYGLDMKKTIKFNSLE